MKLILASSSPRRQQLLEQFGLDFDVKTADVDETHLSGESPGEMTLRLAKLKAMTVFQGFQRQQPDSDFRVLGGDTTVALAGDILGKPEDRDDAVNMLRKLSGRTHSVFSAVALVQKKKTRSILSETQVSFFQLDDNIIQTYCDTDDPYDKAGAYGIQTGAGSFVSTLKGSYTGVIGLPLWHTHQLLMSD